MDIIAIALLSLLILSNLLWYEFFASFKDATIQRYQLISKVLTEEQKSYLKALSEELN